MRPRLLIPFLFAVVPAYAAANTCPDAPDHGAALSTLFGAVQNVTSEAEAQPIVAEMWGLWADAPDEPAQEMLDRGLRKRASYDFLGALQDFEALIAYCPEYAEGYNQRGFIAFIQQDYEAALRDLDVVVSLSPTHVGALSGRALTLMALGRNREARQSLNAALVLNPWLPERRFLEQMSEPDKTDL